jgi:hypothetical protein
MRGIAYSVILIVLGIPLAILALYYWRKNAYKVASVAPAKSASGPAAIPIPDSSGGPSVNVPAALRRAVSTSFTDLQTLLSGSTPGDGVLIDGSEVAGTKLPPIPYALQDSTPAIALTGTTVGLTRFVDRPPMYYDFSGAGGVY